MTWQVRQGSEAWRACGKESDLTALPGESRTVGNGKGESPMPSGGALRLSTVIVSKGSGGLKSPR